MKRRDFSRAYSVGSEAKRQVARRGGHERVGSVLSNFASQHWNLMWDVPDLGDANVPKGAHWKKRH